MSRTILKHAEELIFGDSLNQLVMKKCSTFLQCKHFSYLSTIPGFISLFHSMQNQLVQNNLPLWFSSRSFRHLFWLLSFIHPSISPAFFLLHLLHCILFFTLLNAFSKRIYISRTQILSAFIIELYPI